MVSKCVPGNAAVAVYWTDQSPGMQSGRVIIFGGMGAGLALEDVWELRLRGKRWHWTQLACTGEACPHH